MSDADRVKDLEAQLATLKATQAEHAQSLQSVAAATDPDKPKFVHHAGERFRLPELTDVDIDVIAAFEEGKVVTAAKGILGDQAVNRLRTLHGGKLRVSDLEPILDQVARVYGFANQGE